MVIKHDLTGQFQVRQMKINELDFTKSQEKLSSGLRINRAGDDPSGLAVSEHMRAQIFGLNRANLNAQDGISFIETTDGYLSNVSSILQRIRELAVQSANGIYDNNDRTLIQVEVSALIDEVDRIASHAQFNGLNMLTGKFSASIEGEQLFGSMWFHLGANMNQKERVFIGTITSQSLGLRNRTGNTMLSLSTPDKSNSALGTLDKALTRVNSERASLGAYYNRLFYTSKGLMLSSENTQHSESVIRDADMALEMIRFVKSKILIQNISQLINRNRIVKNDAMLFLLFRS